VKRDRKLEIRVNELVELLQCADPKDGGVAGHHGHHHARQKIVIGVVEHD
jgi:hypothetical protein